MTDEEIADQILRACVKSRRRFIQADPGTPEQMMATMTAEFLSGCSQTAAFLVTNDGAATPQQIERALVIVANRLGLQLGPA